MIQLAALLVGLNETQLRQLILNVGAEQAEFAAAIEREVKLLQRVAASLLTADSPGAPIAVDIAAVCRTLRRDFRAAASTDGGGQRGYFYDDYDDYTIDAGALLDPALTDAEALLAAGAAATATVLLTAVIAEWQECIADLEDYVYEANEESLDEAATAIDALLAESLLVQPLITTERQQWRGPASLPGPKTCSGSRSPTRRSKPGGIIRRWSPPCRERSQSRVPGQGKRQRAPRSWRGYGCASWPDKDETRNISTWRRLRGSGCSI